MSPAAVGRGEVDGEGAREGVLAPVSREPSPDGVVEDVGDDRLDLFIGSQEVIPEALLPEGAMGPQGPGGALGEVLELTHEGDEVARR